MNKYDALKCKAAVLYVLTKSGHSVSRYYLSKILYFANREHLAKYGRNIINDRFVAMENGPVPSTIYDATKLSKDIALFSPQAEENVIIKAIETKSEFLPVSGKEISILKPLEKPDMDELSVSDIEMLDKSITENLSMKFDALRDKSHDAAWKKSWDNRGDKQSVPMSDILLIAESGGADEAMLEYIKSDMEMDMYLKS